MEYLPRPGIVRTSLCGMYVLIPSRIASNYCKKILPMTMAETMIWAGIEKGYPIEKTLERLRIFSKKQIRN